MKTILKKVSIGLAIFLSLAILRVNAQAGTYLKADKIIFLNHTVKVGKVMSVREDKVSFTHKGESLIYDFAKRDIERIEYASGRIDTINTRKREAVPMPANEAENKVAIIPLTYIGEVGTIRSELMVYRLQEIAFDYMQKEARELKFQDAAITNAILGKKGIDSYNIRQYTPKELADILQVEYVIMGTVEQSYADIITSNNTSRTRSGEFTQRGNGISIKEQQNSSGVSNTHQNVQTNVRLTVFNNKGENIFNKSKHSILSTNEAYIKSMHYLLKRTPLYRR